MPSVTEPAIVPPAPATRTARPIRLTVVLTHPIQYFAPWFRHISVASPLIDLTVLYASSPTPAQQGVGFGQPFVWDVPLTEGYRHRIVRPAQPDDRFGSDRYRGLDVPEMVEAVRESRPDVVLTPGWNSITLVRVLRACRRMGVPVLYRGDTYLQSGPSGWMRAPWHVRTRWRLRRFDGFLSVGRRSEAFLRYFGLPPGRIFSAPHCVDNAFFAEAGAAWQAPDRREAVRREYGFDRETFVVLFAGKFETKKRPLDAIRAVGRLGAGAGLLMVGGGPLEEACRREAAALGVRVSWPGFLNQPAMARAYAAADCLALPSDWGETWGLVVNEAMATGLPCVVSNRVGCGPDLVEPEVTGGTFPCGDLDAFAGELARVRARQADGHDFAAACRARVARSSVEQATAGLERACRAVTDRTAAPRRVLACCGSMVVVFGLERVVFEVLEVLRGRGAAVHCIVNSWENHRITARAEQIGASWSIGAYRAPLRRRTWNPIDWTRAAADILLTSAGLVRDVIGFRPTAIFVPDITTVIRNWPGLVLCRTVGLPCVMTVQNAPAASPFYRALWRWGVSPAIDLFGASSRFVESQLLAHGIPARKVRLIYNTAPSRPTDARGQPPVRDPHTVIYVGQIIPEKGVDLLLDAVGLLRRQDVDVRLEVVGQMEGWISPAYGDFRERLRTRAAQPDLAGRVRFLGAREDVPALLAGAAVHCCPSRPQMREGLVLVVLEAKAAATPSVAFDVGPLPEQISHGVDGWICREVSAGALADGLRLFIEDPGRAREAGQRALASAAKFDHRRFEDAWSDVFDCPAPIEALAESDAVRTD